MTSKLADGQMSASYWRKITSPYSTPEFGKSLRQLATAFALFALSWVAMYLSLGVSYWLTLALAFPTACFLVLLFMIQHDCGHGSYFKSRKLRDAVGFCIGVLTLTPYQYWKQTHAYHHAHSGDLDFRGFGDIDTLTVREYRALPLRRRILYRMYRSPWTLLTVGPAFHFVLKHRYPWDVPRDWKQAWRGVWLTNLCLAAILLVASLTIGIKAFLLIQIPVSLIASSIGVLLFYVQHQYEDSYWHRHDQWNYHEAALLGSSHLVLPRPLQWLTGNIGLHHVHHLSSQIPNYRLQECLDANPELQVARKITMKDCVHLFGLTLWDEDAKELISFRELRRRKA